MSRNFLFEVLETVLGLNLERRINLSYCSQKSNKTDYISKTCFRLSGVSVPGDWQGCFCGEGCHADLLSDPFDRVEGPGVNQELSLTFGHSQVSLGGAGCEAGPESQVPTPPPLPHPPSRLEQPTPPDTLDSLFPFSHDLEAGQLLAHPWCPDLCPRLGPARDFSSGQVGV